METTLLLGAAGFLGRHAVDAFQDLAVRGERTGGTPGRLLTPRLRLRNDASELAEMLRRERVTIVVNLTGSTVGTADQLRAANIDTVRTVVVACRASGRRIRLVQFGSAAEYGPGSGVPSSEDDLSRPTSPYAVTKLEATELVLRAHRSGDVDAVVLRVFNPLGAGQPESTLPGRVVAQLAAVPQALRLGDLSAYRDFVDARDVGAAAVAAAAASCGGSVVNIGSGTATQIRSVVRGIARRAGYDGPIEEAEPGSPRSGSVDWQQADVGRARELLGWSPRTELEDSLDQVWKGAA